MKKLLRRWWLIPPIVLGSLILFPLSVGAVTNPDAIDGLQTTLVQMVEGLRITLEAIKDAYQVYLTAL